MDIDHETEMLTAQELASLLRLRIHTVWQWGREGRIPGAVRLGGRTMRFRRGPVLAWLDSRATDATPDPEPREDAHVSR